jgi:hypothetical protein
MESLVNCQIASVITYPEAVTFTHGRRGDVLRITEVPPPLPMHVAEASAVIRPFASLDGAWPIGVSNDDRRCSSVAMRTPTSIVRSAIATTIMGTGATFDGTDPGSLHG